MAADEKWYFTKEQLATTPSRTYGFDADKELSYRQQAANFIQDMGQRLAVSQLCINTAIVYMHRFYVFHSLSQFHRNAIAAAALFLAAKVEEQPRKLEHVIKVAHLCLHREQPALDTKSEQYLDQAQDLVFNENVLLQTLGFDVAIDHPHTHVVRCCHLVKASKDLAQTSYFMASNSLHLTTMCLQYKPTVVACFCIHLACKWSNWEIPQSNEGKHWFWYVDRTVTSELLQQLTAEFLHIFDRCPSRLKRKIMSISANQSPNMSHPSLPSSPFDMEPRKIQSPVAIDGVPTFHLNRPHHSDRSEDKKNSASGSGRLPVDIREYREKKERERIDREKAAAAVQGHAHHHKPVNSGSSQIQGKHQVPQPGQKPHVHHNHHHNRPDINKPGAQLQPPQIPQQSSKHSVNSQQRESAARQRIPREYNSSSGTSGGTVFTHGHGGGVQQQQQTSDNNQASSSGTTSMTDVVLGRAEIGLSSDNLTHNQQDKQGNNNSHNAAHHSADNKHLQPHPPPPTNDKRYDPARHKPPEHRKEDTQKLYGKYASESVSRTERQRNKQPSDIVVEPRSEEVRKLIEKPLQIGSSNTVKNRQELQKEEYAANMIKQSHHHQKYGQDKLQGNNPVVVLNQMKTQQFINTREKSPGNINPNIQQIVPKFNNKSIMQQGQYSSSMHHGTAVTQGVKDNVRNGNANTASNLNTMTTTTTTTTVNVEDIKTEKKPRPEDLERMSAAYLAAQTGVNKHRSLFSPEKSIGNVKESSHQQRNKLKQKTPPAVRNIKQEPVDVKIGMDLISPFASPPAAGNHPSGHAAGFHRSFVEAPPPSSTSSSSTLSHKRHRGSSVCEPEQQNPRIKVEDANAAGLDAMKMLGRVPELIQPIRDNPTSSNGKSSSVANDLKPPELIKPFEPEPGLGLSSTTTINQGANIMQQGLSNGYDLSRMTGQDVQDCRYTHEKRETTTTTTTIITSGVNEHQEFISPLKSARGISALLQETTLPPLPSLLQQQQQQQQQLQMQQIQQQQQQQQQQEITQSMERVAEPNLGASATVQTATTIVLEKKSEHHKSEKKKKKDKHKHKDKDKGKEERKHKHKHKDREKDRHHREKERGGGGGGGDDNQTNPTSASTAIPIKITIPKDKINLSAGGGGGDATSTHQSSSEGSSLKIKIPKERLKGGDNSVETQVQAPLKIKIRTGAASIGNNIDIRKRERETDVGSPTAGGQPPSKKHSQSTVAGGTANTGNYIQRPGPGDRQQNGRHYTTGSAGNNKEKHSSSSSYYKTSSKSSSQHSSHPT